MPDEAHQMGRLPMGEGTTHGFAINRLCIQALAVRTTDCPTRRGAIALLPYLGDAPFQRGDIQLAQSTDDGRLTRHALGGGTQGRVQDGSVQADPLPNRVRRAASSRQRSTNDREHDTPGVAHPTSLAGVGQIGHGIHECAILQHVHRVPPADFGRSTRVYLMDEDFDRTLGWADQLTSQPHSFRVV